MSRRDEMIIDDRQDALKWIEMYFHTIKDETVIKLIEQFCKDEHDSVEILQDQIAEEQDKNAELAVQLKELKAENKELKDNLKQIRDIVAAIDL